MIRACLSDAASGHLQMGGEELIELWSRTRRSGTAGPILWIDLADLPTEQETQLMRGFGLHPNGIKDAQRDRHPPKIEQFADHLFVLLRGLDARSDSADFRTIQLALFAGADFLLTRHSAPSVSIDGLWQELQSEKPERFDPLTLALRISRRMTDRYLGILFRLESRLEAVDEEILSDPQDALLSELSGYKSDLTRLRRNFIYHRQVFESARTMLETPLAESGLIHDFNDVAEQVERVGSLAELYYHLANDLIQSYISLASHRLNGIMKVLTIITAIFVPLSFVAGVYGMNFENMPELGNRYAYFFVLGLMALIVFVLLSVFRRKRWL